VAQTQFLTNDPMAVKLWSRRLAVEALKETQFEKFLGKGSDSLVQIKDETSKGPGDKVTYGLRMQLIGEGVQGDGTLEGNEEALAIYSDALVINQLRHAVRSNGRMSQQRVPFEVRDESLSGLKDWFADRFDRSFFNQLCGFTAEIVYAGNGGTLYTGNNAPVIPDSNHYLNAANYPGGLASPANTDADVTSATFTDAASATQSAKFSLSMLDRAKERAKTLTPAIRPLKVKGKEYFVAFLHPYQVTDLRTNTNPGQWFDIQKAAMFGGEIADNPIFTGALGVYNGIALFEDFRVTPGQNAAGTTQISTVRRGVFCGAQSMMLAFGRENAPEKFTWVEELFDYENQLGVSAGSIFGLKKTVYNSADFSTIVLSSYAAQH
jgi:N4-gp56 family major capsid protein